jgi:hypothetical protein
MKLRTMLALSVVAFATLFAVFLSFSSRHRGDRFRAFLSAPLWQRMAAPGELLKAHASLQNNCAACHTPLKGVEAKNCIVCHADNKGLLQRQPTAFHANIAECAACHLEHQGRVPSTTKMDHVALAHIGCKMLESRAMPVVTDMAKVQRWLKATRPSTHSADHRAAEEALLNCANCHSTKDKHFGLFGADCAQCHATSQWTIPEFRHPSAVSRDCAQCHQAPPSHYMEHFRMISMTVAEQPHARVEQCFLCHQTTSWNDIKGVGFYKHH